MDNNKIIRPEWVPSGYTNDVKKGVVPTVQGRRKPALRGQSRFLSTYKKGTI